MIKGVLWDLDGTLVDSNDAHAASWVKALKETAGIREEFSRVRTLIGMGGDQLLPQLGIYPENELFEKIQEKRGQIFREVHLPKISAFAGARELVEKNLQRGLKVSIASSSSPSDLTALLDQTGLADFFRNYSSAHDVEESKPSPDVIEAALAKIHLSAAEAILIGDTPYDITAARRAGCATLAFRCGGFSDQELHGALAVYDGPWELLRAYRSSVLAQARPAAAA